MSSGKGLPCCTPMPTCLGPVPRYGPKPPPCPNPEKCLKKCKKKRIKCQSALAQMKDRRPDMKCKCLPKMNVEDKQRRKKADKLAQKRNRDRKKHKAPKSSGYGLDKQPKKQKKKSCIIL